MSITRKKQDLRYLKWSHIRSSSGTAGTFLKAESTIGGRKKYYKLSNFDPGLGVVGHECVNEIIVDRLLTLFGIEHLPYELINADIEIEGRTFATYLCASYDFKSKGESKIALDDYYRTNAYPSESHYDFCIRNGWGKYINEMLAVDYIILNRDRHGANIEVLRNARAHTLRIAPLFDHGVSLLYSCTTDDEAQAFNVLEDKPCQNFIGTRSCRENLKLIHGGRIDLTGKLKPTDRSYIFDGLDGILSPVFMDKIWEMIWERYMVYEEL